MIINPYIFGQAINPKWLPTRNVYHFDNDVLDSYGGVNGTVNGGVSYVTGVFNDQILTDGSNDYVSFPNSSFDLVNDFTIAFYLNLPTLTGITSYLFTNFSASPSSNGFSVYLGGGDTLYLLYYLNGAFGQISGGVLSASTQYRVVCTYDSTAGTHKIYVNGSLINTGSSGFYYSYNPSSQSLIAQYNSTGFANMKMDELVIINRVWDSTEVSDDYSNPSKYPA